MLGEKSKMSIVTYVVIRANFVSEISGNTAGVNFYHSTIAVGESLDLIFA